MLCRALSVFILSFLFIVVNGIAQSDTLDNTRTYYSDNRVDDNIHVDVIHIRPNVHIEVGGAGVFYSANFDSRFNYGSRWGYNIGAAYYGGSIFVAPLHVNYLIGSYPHYFEVGGGVTANNLRDFAEIDLPYLVPSAVAKYRYQHPLKNIYFAAGIETVLYYPWPTVGLGFTF